MTVGNIIYFAEQVILGVVIIVTSYLYIKLSIETNVPIKREVVTDLIGVIITILYFGIGGHVVAKSVSLIYITIYIWTLETSSSSSSGTKVLLDHDIF